MKTLRLSGLLASLLILTRASYAEESALAEKIRDISPDKKFAMRISYDAEMYRQMFPEEKTKAKKSSSTLQEGIKAEYFPVTMPSGDGGLQRVSGRRHYSSRYGENQSAADF